MHTVEASWKKALGRPSLSDPNPVSYTHLLGGTPVAMSYGDVYTALSTGIIDGTENNETALTTGKHGEVCKVYSVCLLYTSRCV